MSHYIVIFVAGIAGSFHCIGMCGGFACALGVDPAGKIATLYRHLLYNTGRVTTYMFMGGLAGMAGQALSLPDSMSPKLPMEIWSHHSTSVNFGTILPETLSTGQRILAVFAGLLMLIMALIIGMSETIRTHTQNHNHSIISSLNDHKEIFYYIEENNISKANDALDSHINYWINDRLEKITNNQIA